VVAEIGGGRRKREVGIMEMELVWEPLMLWHWHYFFPTFIKRGKVAGACAGYWPAIVDFWDTWHAIGVIYSFDQLLLWMERFDQKY